MSTKLDEEKDLLRRKVVRQRRELRSLNRAIQMSQGALRCSAQRAVIERYQMDELREEKDGWIVIARELAKILAGKRCPPVGDKPECVHCRPDGFGEKCTQCWLDFARSRVTKS
jgi:hypothetical protein